MNWSFWWCATDMILFSLLHVFSLHSSDLPSGGEVGVCVWGMQSTAAAAAKSLQSCPTLCDPRDSSPPGSPSLGFSRQEHWSGLPFPSPMHENEKWKWSRSVVSDSWRPHGLQPTRLLHPWDFPGKNTGVGCHCLLWCKVLEVPIGQLGDPQMRCFWLISRLLHRIPDTVRICVHLIPSHPRVLCANFPTSTCPSAM